MNAKTLLSDDELLARIDTVLGSERRMLTELVRYLAEVEDRRLHERLKQKLDRVTELLRHANPTGDLAAVVERAVDLLLADVEKKRLGKTERPQPSHRGGSGKRPRGTVTRAAQRETYARDGELCSFVSADGKRCGARGFLQLDHVVPRALRGTGESGNLRVVCAAHNRWFAEQIFGRERIDAAIHFRRRKRDDAAPSAEAGAGATARSGPAPTSKQPTERITADADATYTKLLSGLTGLGFRPKQARTALDSIRDGKSSVAWEAPLDVLLREAVRRLTR